MTWWDRWYVSSFALLVVVLVRLPAHDPLAVVEQLVWAATNAVWLGLLMRRSRQQRPEPTPGQPSRAVRLVQDQLEAFKTAGFTEPQAKDLMQEAMRPRSKRRAGGNHDRHGGRNCLGPER